MSAETEKGSKFSSLFLVFTVKCLDDFCYKGVSDDVFVSEGDCLDALYVFCQFDASQQA
jgi:hypothetical protein